MKPPKKTAKPKPAAPIVSDDTGVMDRMDSEHVLDVGNIPPCPPEDPALLAKTPEVMAWWYQYHPIEAKIKYHGLTYPAPTA